MDAQREYERVSRRYAPITWAAVAQLVVGVLLWVVVASLVQGHLTGPSMTGLALVALVVVAEQIRNFRLRRTAARFARASRPK